MLQEPQLYLSLYFKTHRALTDLVAIDRRRVVVLGRQAASAMLVFDALARRPAKAGRIGPGA